MKVLRWGVRMLGRTALDLVFPGRRSALFRRAVFTLAAAVPAMLTGWSAGGRGLPADYAKLRGGAARDSFRDAPAEDRGR
ncbi:MAG: hypothetical protein ACM3X6_10685 [Patescibacteria group bacterium]